MRTLVMFPEMAAPFAKELSGVGDVFRGVVLPQNAHHHVLLARVRQEHREGLQHDLREAQPIHGSIEGVHF